MLAQADLDNILYGYFPTKRWLCELGQYCTSNFLVQCCLSCTWITLTRLWTVGQNCLHCVRNCFMQCWHKQTKTTLCRLFSCKNMSVRSGPILHNEFSCAMLSQMYLDNIVYLIFLWQQGCLLANVSLRNVSPRRSRQHCKLFSCAKLFMSCGSTLYR